MTNNKIRNKKVNLILFFIMVVLILPACKMNVSAATTCKSAISYPGMVKSDVNMRKKAGTKYKSYGMVAKGTSVVILGYVKNGGVTWYKCRAELQSGVVKTGYISSTYVKRVSKPTGVVNDKVASTVNVRKKAKITAKSLMQIPKQTMATVLDIKKTGGNYWYKVKVSYSGKTKTGYVLGKYIDVKAPVEDTAPEELTTEQATTEEAPQEAYVNDQVTTFLNVRQEASTSSNIVSRIPKGLAVTVLQTVGNWYKIKAQYNDAEVNGYAAKEYITIGVKPVEATTEAPAPEIEQTTESVPVANSDFETQMEAFPESYKANLRALHESYPNWSFVAVNTGLDWTSAVASESVVGKNLIQSNYPGGVASLAPLSYLSKEAGAYDATNNTYKVFDGSNWYSAASEVIAYYMDPRNFLNDTDLFQFEALGFNESQSSTVVESILSGTFMAGDYSVTDSATGAVCTGSYVQAFMDAGKAAGANPYFLASRSKQEVGINGSGATSGIYAGYEGIYNYYNIGANDGAGALERGLLWAKGGTLNANTYGRPWTTPYKSITGGASYIAQNYIAKGQDTLYFQKFNVHPTDTRQLYSHQYMTNVQAPWSEGKSTRDAYAALGILSDNMIFYIPVYSNMPDAACALPAAQ